MFIPVQCAFLNNSLSVRRHHLFFLVSVYSHVPCIVCMRVRVWFYCGSVFSSLASRSRYTRGSQLKCTKSVGRHFVPSASVSVFGDNTHLSKNCIITWMRLEHLQVAQAKWSMHTLRQSRLRGIINFCHAVPLFQRSENGAKCNTKHERKKGLNEKILEHAYCIIIP